jgi:hypothetical protein
MANTDNQDVAWWTKGRTRGNVKRITIREDSVLLKRFLPDIAKSVGSIKMSLMSIIKSQETEQKNQKIERQRQRAADYAARYKKVRPTREDKKAVSNDQKSFFDVIRDGLSSIFKFAFLGLAAIGLSKLLNLSGVIDGIKKFFKNVILTFSDLIQKGTRFLSDLLNDNQIIKSISNVFKSIFNFVATGIEKASDFFKSIVADPKNQESLGKIIKSVIEAIFSGFMAALTVGGNLLSQNKQSIVDGLVKVFVKIADGIAGALKFTTSLLSDEEFRKSIAKIYIAIKDFINVILNEPIPIAGNITFKQAIITVALGLFALDLALTAFMGAMIGRAVSGGGGGGARKGRGKSGVAGDIAAYGIMGAAGVITGKEVYDAFIKNKQDSNTLKDFASEANTNSPTALVTPSYSQAIEPTPGQALSGAPLLDLIAGKEAGKAGYDAANRGKAGDTPGGYPGLSKLTVGQVMDLQAQRSPRVLFAAGRYQIIPDTLAGLVKSGVVKRDEQFSPVVQDRLATELINRRLKAAGSDPLKQQLELAKEFASIAVPYDVINNKGIAIKAGQSYYEGQAGNRAAISTQSIQAALGKKYDPDLGNIVAGTGDLKPYPSNAISSSDQSNYKPYPQVTQNVTNGLPNIEKSNIRSIAGRAQSFGQTLQDTLASLVSTGPGSDFLRQLDEMTGGKLGIASGELATALRTRNLFFDSQEDTIIDASRTLASTSSNQWEGPIPSVYDETLLEKFKVV